MLENGTIPDIHADDSCDDNQITISADESAAYLGNTSPISTCHQLKTHYLQPQNQGEMAIIQVPAQIESFVVESVPEQDSSLGMLVVKANGSKIMRKHNFCHST